MKLRLPHLGARAALLCLFLLLLVAGCSGLAGEPRIVASLPPPTALPTPAPYPPQHPDVALGADVFAANCTRCHGVDGSGNGEFVQSGQVAKPADFTDAATTADQTPSDYYAIITDGKIAQLMPPWGDTLTEAERWAAALYVYTLAFTQDEIARGSEVCAQCAADDLASLSGNALDSRIAQANPALDAAERHAAAAYLRSLAVANPDAIGTFAQAEASGSATAEATAAVDLPDTVSVSGSVTNGTAGGSSPAELPVMLYVFDADLNQQQFSATTDAAGAFVIPDVPLNAASTYVVTVGYRERTFTSDLLAGETLVSEAGDGTLTLPVTIYELTEDPAVIEITGMVTQVSVAGDSLQVAQVFNITNTGDRAFTSTQITDNGGAISLVISLPPGAIVAGFPDSQNRYIVDQNSFTVFDTLPVLPGEQHLVQVVYLVEYGSGSAIIEQLLNYALSGPVRLLVSPLTVSVSSQQLAARGTETVGSSQFQGYGADLALAAGEVLRYELSGTGANVVNGVTVPTTSNNLIMLVIGGLVIALLLGGGLVVLGTRNRAGDQQVIDTLVRQIAELDADHDAGKLDDDAHERQRAALKARLAALMERKRK